MLCAVSRSESSEISTSGGEMPLISARAMPGTRSSGRLIALSISSYCEPRFALLARRTDRIGASEVENFCTK